MEKIEIGYEVQKERWMEAAANMEDLANILVPALMQMGGEKKGRKAADELTADLLLAGLALNYVAEFAADKCRIIPMPEGGLK